VIVTCIGSDMGKVAINKVECLTNQQINSIILYPNNFLADYVYYSLIGRYELLRNMATGGSTMPIINKSQFEGIEIIIPSNALVIKFQNVLDSINERIGQNLVQNKTLSNLRDTLLPKLMTGKIRVA
jgi:type I restriction enzyme S subunit